MKLFSLIRVYPPVAVLTAVAKAECCQSWLRDKLSRRLVQAEVVNATCLGVIVLNLLMSCTHFWFSYQWYGVISLLALGLLLLNKSGFFPVVRWLLVAGLGSLAWLLAATGTPGWLVAVFFLTGWCVCWLLFSSAEKWQLAGSLILFNGCFTLLQMSAIAPRLPVVQADSLLDRAFVLNIGCVLLSVLLAIGYLLLTYERSERQLRQLVDTLQGQEKEIQAQNEELRIRNHELDNYVYRVSHDLRSPLCSMLGLLNLARHTDEVATLRSYLHLIEDSVRKSDIFIQSILNHSKILNAEAQMEAIDVAQLIEKCRTELAYLTDEKIMRFTTQVDGSAVLYADQFRLTIVLQSLISNALRFYKPGAPSRKAHVAVTVSQTEARITVSDDGIGIEARHLPRIFDMFFRGTERSNGSGLGLYIARQAVEKMSGSISVSSQPDAGAVFDVRIPNHLPG